MAEYKIPLGHITMVPKGDYDSSVTYNRLDLVTQKDENNKIIGLYISKINNNLNNPLPDSETDSESWMKIMTESDYQGPQGDTGPTGRGISSIIGPTNPGQVGEPDTYVINYTDGEFYAFTVNNGVTGPAAGFGTPTYSITGTTGPLKVTVGATGPNTEKIFDFKFEIPESSDSNATWGSITGSISDQTDLQNILNSKANNSNLGTMATINDAPLNNNKIYGRNNGSWVEITNSGSSSGSGDGTVNNPIQFNENGDNLQFGLFESGTNGEYNAILKLIKAPDSAMPGFTIQQIDNNNNDNNKTLTLLSSDGQTIIPELSLGSPLSIENGGTGKGTDFSLITKLDKTGEATLLFDESTNSTLRFIPIAGILPTGNGGTGVTGPGLQLLENLGIHVTSIDPGENANLDTGHILLIYEA